MLSFILWRGCPDLMLWMIKWQTVLGGSGQPDSSSKVWELAVIGPLVIRGQLLAFKYLRPGKYMMRQSSTIESTAADEFTQISSRSGEFLDRVNRNHVTSKGTCSDSFRTRREGKQEAHILIMSSDAWALLRSKRSSPLLSGNLDRTPPFSASVMNGLSVNDLTCDRERKFLKFSLLSKEKRWEETEEQKELFSSPVLHRKLLFSLFLEPTTFLLTEFPGICERSSNKF